MVLLFLAVTSPVHACNIPVFRFALEQWPADRYRLVIYHNGTLSAVEQAELDTLEKYLDADNTPVNLTLERRDVGRLLRAFSAAPPRAWMALRYPEHAHIAAPALVHPLDGAVIKSFLDSPARRTIAQRILRGESVVWVFLDSGDKAADDAAHALLKTKLAELEKTLELPKLTTDPKDKLQAEQIELKIAFSILRIAADDADEIILRRMLMNMEEDITERKEPMVFPVFGRGIALYALVGKGINEDTIAGAARFLTEKCSCEVKRLNPGVDLLMTATWEESLGGRLVPAPELPPLIGLLRPASAETQTEETHQVVLPPLVRTPPPSSFVWLYVGGGLAFVSVILAVATWFILRKT
jgi:hypothetical protein